jgi:hypothetical protein
VKKTKKVKRYEKRYIYIGGKDDEKAIFIYLRGGLGNQLYVYAAALVVKNKLGLPLYIIPYRGNVHSKVDYSTLLLKGGISVEEKDVKSRINAANKVLGDKEIYAHNDWTQANITQNISKNIFIAGGSFQNYKAIQSAIPQIRMEISDALSTKYPDMKKDIIPSKSAFMHVRRGDYVNGAVALGKDYYQRALDILDSIKDIYIVSEDLAWCKEQGWTSNKNLIWFESDDEVGGVFTEIKTIVENLNEII